MVSIPSRVGSWLSGDPDAYAYLPTSVGTFPDADELVGQLRRHGLDPVTAQPLTGGVATLYDAVKTAGADARRTVGDDDMTREERGSP